MLKPLTNQNAWQLTTLCTSRAWIFSDEAQCQPQSEVPIIDKISDELLMHGIECDVEHAGTEVQAGPKVQVGSEVQVEPEVQAGPEVQVEPDVHDGPEVEPPEEEVHIPSFD